MNRPGILFPIMVLLCSCKASQNFNTATTTMLVETGQALMENNKKVVAHVFTVIQKNTDAEFQATDPYAEKNFDSILTMLSIYEQDKAFNKETVLSYNQLFNVLNDFNSTIKLFISDSVDMNTSGNACALFGNLNCSVQDLNIHKVGKLQLTDSLISATNLVVLNMTQNRVAKLRKKYLIRFLSLSQHDFNAICDYLATVNTSVLQSLILRQKNEEMTALRKEFAAIRMKESYTSDEGKKFIKNATYIQNQWTTDSVITAESSKGYTSLKGYYGDLIKSLKAKKSTTQLLNNLKDLYFTLYNIKNTIKFSTNEISANP